MAVLEQVVRHGKELGMFEESLAKAREVHEMAYRSLEYLYRNGARIGMGTDLFEERFAHMQNQEFSFRADIVKPIDLLRSATSINAEILQKVVLLASAAPGDRQSVLLGKRFSVGFITEVCFI